MSHYSDIAYEAVNAGWTNNTVSQKPPKDWRRYWLQYWTNQYTGKAPEDQKRVNANRSPEYILKLIEGFCKALGIDFPAYMTSVMPEQDK